MQHLRLRGLYHCTCILFITLGGSIAEIEKSEIDFIDAVAPRNRARPLVQDLQRSPKHTLMQADRWCLAHTTTLLTLRYSLTPSHDTNLRIRHIPRRHYAKGTQYIN